MLFGVLLSVLSSATVAAACERIESSLSTFQSHLRGFSLDFGFPTQVHGAQCLAEFVKDKFGAFCDANLVVKPKKWEEEDEYTFCKIKYTQSKLRCILNSTSAFFFSSGFLLMLTFIYLTIHNGRLKNGETAKS